MSEPLVVLTTLPDEASARALARELIAARLAACVQVLPPCRSVYRWQDAVEEATETPLQIKTSAACYAALERAIVAAHPYDVPEIIALPVQAGLPAYLDWITAETTPD